jgi:nickel/cobalt transporter (NicO) family protein
MTLRRVPFVAGFAVTMIVTALPAVSHPLGGFSIDHYSRLRVATDALRLRYVIDMAEIPAYQELQRADANGDATISEAERNAYLQRKVRELAAGISTTLDGEPVHWRIEYSNLTAPSRAVSPDVGGGTFRIFMDLRTDLPPAMTGPHVVRYEDRNYPARTGWKELVVVADDGMRLVRSSASGKDLSNELTSYPNLPAPPQDVLAEIAFEPGSGARVPVEVWILVGMIALGSVGRWRRRTA